AARLDPATVPACARNHNPARAFAFPRRQRRPLEPGRGRVVVEAASHGQSGGPSFPAVDERHRSRGRTMASSQPFTFGIALIPRASARNWRLVEALLDLTLASVRAQTDPNFRVVLVGHDRPGRLPRDPRFAFLEADWPVEAPGPDNADSGRKRYLINEFVLARGGGYLMFLDADDWV